MDLERGRGRKAGFFGGSPLPRAVEEERVGPVPTGHPGARLKFSRGGGDPCPAPQHLPGHGHHPPPAFKSSGGQAVLALSAMAAGPEASGECGICYEAYWGAGGGRAPQQLPCRHSLCLNCLRKLVCHAATVAFVSCPFCRMVTLVPELALGGPGAMPASGTPHGEEEEEEEGSITPPDTRQASASSVAVEVACTAHAPVFAVSGMVSPCGLRRGSEAPGTFVLGLLGRGLLLDTQPPLASMENLRLGFAAGILVLIVSTFFLLVFLK